MRSTRTKSSLLFAAGIITYALAAFHAAFWTLFDWESDLASLAFENRAIVQTLNVCMIYLLLVIASLSVFARKELIGTRLGKMVAASVAGFWIVRLATQAIFFGFARPISYAMSAAFVVMAVPYVLAAASPSESTDN